MRALCTAVLLALVVGLAGCNQSEQSEPVSRDEINQAQLSSGALKYDRDKYFGGRWKIVHGRCDVREVLIARASGPDAVDTDRDGCKDDGTFVDPYTGNIITGVQSEVDHVYPVKRFWDASGWLRTQAEREDFYQDQANLMVVTAGENQAKSDLGPDKWRPPARSGWCEFARKYQYTTTKYLQPVTPGEDVALREMLATCPRG